MAALRYPVRGRMIKDQLGPQLHARGAQPRSRPGDRRADDRARRISEARRRPLSRSARRARPRSAAAVAARRRAAATRPPRRPGAYARVMALNDYLFSELRFVGNERALRGSAQQLPERGARPAHRHSDHAGAALHGSRAARGLHVEGINFPGHFPAALPRPPRPAVCGGSDHRRVPRRRAAVRRTPAASCCGVTPARTRCSSRTCSATPPSRRFWRGCC